VTEQRVATIRFYFDADVLGVAKVVAALRHDVTYPGDQGATINRRVRRACPITTPALKDEVWIPEVAKRGWLIITRDRHIQDHPAEIAAVRDHGAKMVALSAPDAVSVWNQLEVVMSNWRRFEDLTSQPGPFIWRASRTSLGKVKLD
jgi:PIN domain-containing protein